MQLEIAKVTATVAIAVLGWFVAYWFTLRRDVRARRRELSTEHLINAYRVLANDISHRELGSDDWRKLEDILSDIQLFGTGDQVNMARDLATEIAAKRSFELDPLINSLRGDLRRELGLSRVEGNLTWLRWTPED